MRTIAVLNQKGGVGKTTTVTNTAAALAKLGARVLVIDLDPQAHLTIHLGVEPQAIKGGSYEVLTKSAEIKESLVQTRPNLWLLPANVNLVGAETELVSVVGREVILSEAIESVVKKFDYLFIDCAPSLGLLTLNALAACEEVLIPLQPHFLALQGFGKLLQTVDLVNKRINPRLKVSGILLCMYDSRALLPSEVKADIEQFLKNARGSGSAWADAKIIPRLIRRNIKLAEAPSYGKTIFEYEPECNGAQDYAAVAKYIYAQTHPVAKTASSAPATSNTQSPPKPEAKTPNSGQTAARPQTPIRSVPPSPQRKPQQLDRQPPVRRPAPHSPQRTASNTGPSQPQRAPRPTQQTRPAQPKRPPQSPQQDNNRTPNRPINPQTGFPQPVTGPANNAPHDRQRPAAQRPPVSNPQRPAHPASSNDRPRNGCTQNRQAPRRPVSPPPAANNTQKSPIPIRPVPRPNHDTRRDADTTNTGEKTQNPCPPGSESQSTDRTNKARDDSSDA